MICISLLKVLHDALALGKNTVSGVQFRCVSNFDQIFFRAPTTLLGFAFSTLLSSALMSQTFWFRQRARPAGLNTLFLTADGRNSNETHDP